MKYSGYQTDEDDDMYEGYQDVLSKPVKIIDYNGKEVSFSLEEAEDISNILSSGNLEFFVDKIMNGRGAVSRDELIAEISKFLLECNFTPEFYADYNGIKKGTMINLLLSFPGVAKPTPAQKPKLESTHKKEVKKPNRFTGFLKNEKGEEEDGN